MSKYLKEDKNKTNYLDLIPIQPKLLTLAIAQALAIQAAHSASIEVTSNLDDGTDCTLREAVESVNMGSDQGSCISTGTFGTNDTITFGAGVAGSTVTLNGTQIYISRSVSINPGGSDTTISGNNLNHIFSSGASEITVDLNNLVLTQGKNNFGYGGAIDFFGGGGSISTLTLVNSTISNNTSAGKGGGVYAGQWNVIVDNTTIAGNAAEDGGGLYANSSNISLMNNSTVSGNTASTRGGGLRATSSTVTLTNGTMSGNYASIHGGGLFVDSNISVGKVSEVTLTNSTLSNNSAGLNGGGLYTAPSFVPTNVLLTDSSVLGNSAYHSGGGLYVYFGRVTLTNSTVSGNTASDGDGGGLFVYISTVDLTNSTVSSNTADSTGGGLRASSSRVNLVNSTVSGNTADFAGGGLYARSFSIVNLTNSTVSGNSADRTGGGLNTSSSSRMNLINSTVSDNSAVLGGGVFNISATVNLNNSIVANSLGGYDCDRSDAMDVVTAGPRNIIENDACGATALSIDPGLLLLTDNGGPTETHALMPGSPAIDGGNNATCEAIDQRGEARDDEACDIGAYEFKATVMPIINKDRKEGALMSNGEQWYSFNSTESQKLSMQTNGFSGDTTLDLYEGDNFASVVNISMDDDSGPHRFSNIKQEVISGPYLIRVKSKTAVDPYWLRLMSDKDILSFGDTASHFAKNEIRVMSSAGITGGCGTNKYCPTDPVTRAQMAIFMLKAILGGNHSSPPASGSVFSDVGTSSFGASFIEEFSTLGITSGCGGGKYCPDLAVTREQMAVFLLRAWYGSSYTPPAATPAEINQFSDIANSFARDWIVQLTKENITGGCGGGKYCPTDTVTRGQMAAFITRTFSLDTEL